jgi:hypothetical protein
VACHPGPGSAGCRDGPFPTNRAVQRVDQDLNLDELVAGPLGLVTVKGRGQHLRMHVPVLEHARTGLVQRFKSLAHFGFFHRRNRHHAAGTSVMRTPIQLPALSINGVAPSIDAPNVRIVGGLRARASPELVTRTVAIAIDLSSNERSPRCSRASCLLNQSCYQPR